MISQINDMQEASISTVYIDGRMRCVGQRYLCRILVTEEVFGMLLYHGSKSGISGPIAPISRARCEFGRGFYMGTDREQPLTLVCNYQAPVFYEVEFDPAGLNVVSCEADTEWALAESICRQFRRDGRYFDEIVGDGALA